MKDGNNKRNSVREKIRETLEILFVNGRREQKEGRGLLAKPLTSKTIPLKNSDPLYHKGTKGPRLFHKKATTQ